MMLPSRAVRSSFFLVCPVLELSAQVNPKLIELTKIDSGTALPELLDRIVVLLRQRFRYIKADSFDAATALSEICQNTFDHNDGTCGFIAMQVYGHGAKEYSGDRCCRLQAERLAATLARNPKNRRIVSDLDAIQHATKLGTSEYDNPLAARGCITCSKLHPSTEDLFKFDLAGQKSAIGADQHAVNRFTVHHMRGVQIVLTLTARTRA